MAKIFNSTGNYFGAGVINFKSHQEENFVVLNAKFSYNPENAAYQAADVLEIYVPDLSIERSSVSAVYLMFQDRYPTYSSVWINDGGTVLKSWVKDKNTLCIEKLTNFPKDITADVPFCGGGNQYNPSVDGMSAAHIENGVFTCAERSSGFDDTGHDPFIFAYLVRDGEETTDGNE